MHDNLASSDSLREFIRTFFGNEVVGVYAEEYTHVRGLGRCVRGVIVGNPVAADVHRVIRRLSDRGARHVLLNLVDANDTAKIVQAYERAGIGGAIERSFDISYHTVRAE